MARADLVGFGRRVTGFGHSPPQVGRFRGTKNIVGVAGAPTHRGRLPNRVTLQTRYIPHPLDAALPVEHMLGHVSDEPITVLDRHDVLELGLCLEGSGSYVVEDKIMSYRPGSLVIVNDVEWHYSQSAPGTTSRWANLFLRPEVLISGIDPDRGVLSTGELCGTAFENVLSPDEHPEMTGLVRALFQEVSNNRTGKEAAIKGLVWAVMANLHRLPGRSLDAPSKLVALTTIAPALDRIKTGYSDDIDLPELATVCHMSPRTFTRHFQAALDDTPMRFVNRYRIARACEQLAGSAVSVLNVSLNVGFNSLAAFNRHFRALTGRTPRDWRRQPYRSSAPK